MANQPVKHEPHEPPRGKVVGEEGSLVLPLADSGGAPLVGATGVRGEHIEDGERDPDTIAEEQRRRSAALEAGATMAEVATTDLPDVPQGETRRVAPPVQHQAPKPEPHAQSAHHENDHRTTKK